MSESVKSWKNIMCAKNVIFGILLRVVSIIENLVIACDEILDSAKAVPTSNTQSHFFTSSFISKPFQ